MLKYKLIFAVFKSSKTILDLNFNFVTILQGKTNSAFISFLFSHMPSASSRTPVYARMMMAL